MATHKQNATRFEAMMIKTGAAVRSQRAGTGTIYVTVNDTFKVRFADHGECYCREDISVDPDGCTIDQAVAAAGKALDLDVSSAITSMNAAKKAAATRKAKFAETFQDKMARREAAINRWIATNVPGFESMKSSKQRAFTMQAVEATKGEWA